VRAYAAARVKECLLILGPEKKIEVYRQPADGHYTEQTPQRRLSQNSEFASKNFEKHHQNTLARNKNAAYRKCERSFLDRLLDF
jgi:hypothetical protein